jgi:hypothetical protein
MFTLFGIRIIKEKSNREYEAKILKQLSIINNQNSKIMALIDDLTAQVADLSTKTDLLQTTLDAEQLAIAELLATNAQVVTDPNAHIVALNEQISNGATPEQLQAIVDGLTTISAKVDAASEDVASTV